MLFRSEEESLGDDSSKSRDPPELVTGIPNYDEILISFRKTGLAVRKLGKLDFNSNLLYSGSRALHSAVNENAVLVGQSVSNKDKFAGEVYLEMTFWSNVRI